MKIVIQRKITASHVHGVSAQDVAEYMSKVLSYMVNVFTCMCDHGWIRDVEVVASGNLEEKIIITMLPQGDANCNGPLS